MMTNYFDKCDRLLIMTVNPGFGSQHFLPLTLNKIATIHEMIAKRNPNCELEVDGGIDATTISLAQKAGAKRVMCVAVCH